MSSLSRSCWSSGAALGAGTAGTNTARIFFRLVASEKMSNRSKKDSLDAENEYFLARERENEVLQKWSFLEVATHS